MKKNKEVIHTSWVSWQHVFNNSEEETFSAKKIKEKQEKFEDLLRAYISFYKQFSDQYKNQFAEFTWSVNDLNDKDFDLHVDIRITIEDMDFTEPGGGTAIPDRIIKTPPPPVQPPAP